MGSVFVFLKQYIPLWSNEKVYPFSVSLLSYKNRFHFLNCCFWLLKGVFMPVTASIRGVHQLMPGIDWSDFWSRSFSFSIVFTFHWLYWFHWLDYAARTQFWNFLTHACPAKKKRSSSSLDLRGCINAWVSRRLEENPDHSGVTKKLHFDL